MGDIAEEPATTPETSVSFAQAHYSESISVGITPREPLPSYVSFIDFKVIPRQKSEVHFDQFLRPVGYENRLIVYTDSTRKKFKSVARYEPKNTPVRYAETYYMRPRHAEQTFLSCLDVDGIPDRKWYQSTLQLVPVTHSSSHITRFEMTTDQVDSDGEGVEYEDTVFSEDVRMDALTSHGHVAQNVSNHRAPHAQQSFSTSVFINGPIENGYDLHNGHISDEESAA